MDSKRSTDGGTLMRSLLLAILTIAGGTLSRMAGFSWPQVLASSVFLMTVLATLFFWTFRLAIAFLGIAILLAARLMDIERLVASCALDVILFLIGMMVIVAVLKELGFFTWIIQGVLGIRRINGTGFIVILMELSAILACLVDEVTSIVFISTLVFQVADTLQLDPKPYLVIAVLATNIGSAATMLGNPIGILIGYRAGLTFLDFLLWSLPVALLVLLATLAVVLVWFRKDITLLSSKLRARRERGRGLVALFRIPYQKSLLIVALLVLAISSHHVIEKAFGIQKNTLLIAVPLLVAGGLMLWRHDRARHYVEREVEWWTLLFFMLLFATVGTLEQTGVVSRIAEGLRTLLGRHRSLVMPAILFSSAAGSAFLDNVVLVAAAIPIVREMGNHMPFWWALLYGGCLGGNVTMIGSTANIVALGLLEKRYRTTIRFGEWFRLGLVVGLVSCGVAWAALALASRWMPLAPTP